MAPEAGRSWGRAAARGAVAPAVVLFAGLLATAWSLVAMADRAERAERRQAVAGAGAAAAFAVEQQLFRSLSAAYALAAVVRRDERLLDFEALAGEMMALYGGISSLQLAPGGVLRRIHPLAGNEAALGLDLFAEPLHREDALATLGSRRLTLAGPFVLRQGGVGLAGRIAVFRPDAARKEAFWGFAAVVIRLPALLEACRISRLAESGYDYQLLGVNRVTQRREPFAR